ncbi:MAG: hypothetical protein RIG61_10950 [Deltaproteobacteria bacterium]
MSEIKFFMLLSIFAFTMGLVGCNIEKEEEGELPDVDVEADSGNLPDYEVVKKEEGELPDVDVDVDEGTLPDYDVELPDVDVGVTKRTVKVPKVIVVMEEEEVQVPYIDIDMPGDNDADDIDDYNDEIDDDNVTDDDYDNTDDVNVGEDDDKRDDNDKTEKTLVVEVEVPSPNYDVEIDKIYLVKDRYIVLAQLEKGDDADEEIQKTVRISDRVVLRGPDLDVRYYVIGGRPEGSHNEQYSFIESEDEIEGKLENGKVLWED